MRKGVKCPKKKIDPTLFFDFSNFRKVKLFNYVVLYKIPINDTNQSNQSNQ